MLKNKHGITLLALVITIIVLVILAGVALNALFGTNGILNVADSSRQEYLKSVEKDAILQAFQSLKIKQYMGELSLSAETIENELKSAGNNVKVTDYGLEDYKIEFLDTGHVYIVDKNGVILNSNTDSNSSGDSSANVDLELDETSVNGTYKKVGNVYVNTPKLDEGFIAERTRYMYLEGDYLVPGGFAVSDPDSNWYNYAEQKWANIFTEMGGFEIYYVWIPRYCFKQIEGQELMDIKFLSIDNIYRDENGNETPYEYTEGQEIEGKPDLKTQGYLIPEAFSFNNTPLTGFWAMKYVVGEDARRDNIWYRLTYENQKIKISEVSLQLTETVAKYDIYINGVFFKSVSASELQAGLTIDKNLNRRNNVVNITALDANGEIIKSKTKDLDVSDLVIYEGVNEPLFIGFDREATYYVTWDNNGNEHSVIPISQSAPSNWYDYSYGEKRWANIVIRNESTEAGNKYTVKETYYVWIPRFEYKFKQYEHENVVRFLKGIAGATNDTYKVPEAFTFNGRQLTGYWAMKYPVGEVTTEPSFYVQMDNVEEISGGIRINGVEGTGVASGQVYNYYLDNVYKGQTTSAGASYTFSNLESNREYIIMIEIRSSSDALLGTIKINKKIGENKPQPNAPVLTGFPTENTYYVTYDSNGNEDSSVPISQDPPYGWYNYAEKKWANIVVKQDGKTTYYVWIPRYQYKLNQRTQQSDVIFLSGTSTTVQTGYKIPEAFSFNNTPIPGYWAMKYVVGEITQ